MGEQVRLYDLDIAAAKLQAIKTNSAWKRGVKIYAEELLQELTSNYATVGILALKRFDKHLERLALFGADDWLEYSEGGCSLIHNEDIAERLCNRTVLKQTDGGRNRPNKRETWVDVQARALKQAYELMADCIRESEFVWANTTYLY